jgi:hypothetical protein
MNPAWLFHHIVDALRSSTYGPRPRDVYCPVWLAVGLGGAGLVFLVALITRALWSAQQ